MVIFFPEVYKIEYEIHFIQFIVYFPFEEVNTVNGFAYILPY